MSRNLVRKLVSSKTIDARHSNFFTKVILHRFFELNSVSRSIQAGGLTWEQIESFSTFHFWTKKFVDETRLKMNDDL
jgi:hypothetical protein